MVAHCLRRWPQFGLSLYIFFYFCIYSGKHKLTAILMLRTVVDYVTGYCDIFRLSLGSN